MRRLATAIIAAVVLGGILFFLKGGEDRSLEKPNPPSSPSRPGRALKKEAQLDPHSEKSFQKEDRDIFQWIKSLTDRGLSEKYVLELLASDLSENKKAVLLESYLEQKPEAIFTDNTLWLRLLTGFITDSTWSDLANKASALLELLNQGGEYDRQILKALRSVPSGDEIKTTALVSALHSREILIDLLSEDFPSVAQEAMLERVSRDMSTQDLYNFVDDESRSLSFRERSLGYLLERASTTEDLYKMLNAAQNMPSASKFMGKSNLLFSAANAPVAKKSLFFYEKLESSLASKASNNDLFDLVYCVARSFLTDPSDEGRTILMVKLMNLPENASVGTKSYYDWMIFIQVANLCDGDKMYDGRGCAELESTLERIRNRIVNTSYKKYLTSR